MATIEQFYDILNHAFIVADFAIAATALLLYDYAVTFRMEVDLIWLRRWNTMTVIYILQRYLPFMDTFIVPIIQFARPSLEVCKAGNEIRYWSCIIGICLSEIILSVRVWAIWRQSKILTIILPIWWVACHGASLALMGVFLKSLRYSEPPLDTIGCWLTAASSHVIITWILLMVHEAGIVALLAYKAYHTLREGGNSALYTTVYRDGLLYYLYLFALSIINIALMLTLPVDCISLLNPLERVIHSLLTSRVVLHIRDQASKDVLGSIGQQQDHTTMAFGNSPELSWSAAAGLAANVEADDETELHDRAGYRNGNENSKM